jgi:hypothetical protein
MIIFYNPDFPDNFLIKTGSHHSAIQIKPFYSDGINISGAQTISRGDE